MIDVFDVIHNIHVGNKVTITEGPFYGMIGTVKEITNNGVYNVHWYDGRSGIYSDVSILRKVIVTENSCL